MNATLQFTVCVCVCVCVRARARARSVAFTYEGWNFNSGKYLFTTDTK